MKIGEQSSKEQSLFSKKSVITFHKGSCQKAIFSRLLGILLLLRHPKYDRSMFYEMFSQGTVMLPGPVGSLSELCFSNYQIRKRNRKE